MLVAVTAIVVVGFVTETYMGVVVVVVVTVLAMKVLQKAVALEA